MAGLYLHIPFCKQACHYCDFHFSTNQSYRFELCQALTEEIKLQQDYLPTKHLESIYFGGGTPSILSEPELDLLVSVIRETFHISPGAEITLEANPDDMSAEKLKHWHQVGINRLSVGVQSFDDGVLQSLNRSHTSHTALHSLEAARTAGFNNINLDLIFAIPGQTHEQLENNLSLVEKIRPSHISAYSLTIEEKTAFGKWSKTGKLVPVGEEQSAQEFERIMDWAARCGYEQYEISNFALPGLHARHNSNYWLGVPYLGVGPSAHSYNGSMRQHNHPNNHQYMRSIAARMIPATLEVLTPENQVNEYILTSLRTSWGMDLSRLQNLSGKYYPELKAQLDSFIHLGMLINETGKVKLTRKGKMIADRLAEELFLA
ncbi:MAG: radical SAM family heme chaperone HemW [Cyclobacteriaceae bacterium]|nr:radical SAM family heme chaperone HemW [Cyclobacteriaceae bacterium]